MGDDLEATCATTLCTVKPVALPCQDNLDTICVRTYLTVRAFLSSRVEVHMSEAARDTAPTASAAGGAAPIKNLYCSFCFKSRHDVKMLISGPGGIFICDECVDLCNECRAGRFPDKSKLPSDEGLPTERLLERLQAIEDTVQGKARSLSDLSLSRNYPKGIPSWAQFHYDSWRTRDIIFQKIPIFA